MSDFPRIIEPATLEAQLQNKNLLLIDVSDPATYVQYHIPGAVFLEYAWIIHSEKPRMGLLPDAAQLSRVLGSLGLGPDTHVVAYDDEGGGRASRLLWTLDVVGHHQSSLLNGGLSSWTNEGHPVSSEIQYPTPRSYQANIEAAPVTDRQYILDHLNNESVIILDARSAEEYRGEKVFAQRGGHIPGAININWLDTMDRRNHMRFKPMAELQELLNSRGITPDKEVIVHCQTHHRSAHTYVMLKSLGYEKVRGYPGSWSDWGNDSHTPIEN